MLFTLAAVVFVTSICVFFSQEFIGGFRRLMEIRGVKLVLPLTIASILVTVFEYWVLWALYYIRHGLLVGLQWLSRYLPIKFHVFEVALVLLLTAGSVFPVYVLNWINIKRKHRPYPHPYLTSTMLWIVLVSILVVLGTTEELH